MDRDVKWLHFYKLFGDIFFQVQVWRPSGKKSFPDLA